MLEAMSNVSLMVSIFVLLFLFQKGVNYMKIQNWKSSIIRFLTAQTISLFGSSLVQYAIVWYITLTTSSGKMLTFSTICGFLPQIMVSLFAGVWIDKYNRKKLIMISDSLIALSTLALAISFVAGYSNMELLFIVLAIRSAGTGIQTPAVNAIIPQMVPKEKLMKVSGINSTLSSFIMFISPAISGAILSIAPFEVILLVDVVTAIIGVFITSTVSIEPYNAITQKVTSHLNEIKSGFLYLLENRFMKRLLLFQIIILFLISPSAFLTPLLVNRTFGEEIWRLSASQMTYSLGMVLGGLLIAVWGGFKNKINTTILAGGIYGFIMLGLSFAPTFIIYLIFNMLIGITSPCYNAPITVTIQEKVTPEMHGRIFSFMQISTSCALPLGMILFGPLADLFTVQQLLMSTGLLVVLLTLFVFCFSYFREDGTPSSRPQ